MQVCAAAERSHSRAPNDTLSVAGHTGNAAVRSARRQHRRTDAPLAKPQAGRRACGLGLSRRPAKISEPRALRGQPCERATSGGSLPPPVRAHLRPRSFCSLTLLAR